jgi:hypothetical protein
MDMRTVGLIACAIVAAAMVARILWLFTNRVPVLAHAENALNPPEHPQGLQRMSPFHTADMRLDYEVAGKHYERDVETRSIDGLDMTAPDDMPILWTDPANPTRVERLGPGFWVAALIAVGLCATVFFQFT